MLLPLAAGAASIQTFVTPFTGDPSSVLVVLTEVGDDIEYSLSVEEGQGDLRGLFFDIADDSLLAGLDVTGAFVSGFATGSVIDLGNGNNLNGGGTPCPCDVGVDLGTPGMGTDDLQATTFLVSHVSESLTLAQFYGQDIGVRVTSVSVGGGRGGSSKLGGMLPVPESSTGLLLLMGLVLLGARGAIR